MLNKMIKLIKNPYLYSIVSKMAVALVGVIFTVLQARYLGTEIKGQVAYVTSITSISSIVLGFGMHQAYPYYKKRCDYDILPLFYKLALCQFLLYTIISIVIAIWLSNIKMIAIVLVTPIMIYNKNISYITMIEEPNQKNTIEMIINFAELLFVIFLYIVYPASFMMGILIIVFKDILMAVIYSLRWKNRVFNGNRDLNGWIIKIIKFGAFPMLALLMTTLNYRVDVIMLDGKVSDSQIGIYSVGVMLAERIWLIPDAMKEVMVSKVSKGKGVEEVALVIRVCNTVCMLVALVVAALGYPFINILFGKDYCGAYPVTLILLIGVFFMIYYKMIASYNIVIGKQIVNFLFLGISVIGNVAANYILIPLLGIYGAGIASVISYGICSVLFFTNFAKSEHIPINTLLFATPSDFKRFKLKLNKER